jgi:parallel beta-helix repeat protein
MDIGLVSRLLTTISAVAVLAGGPTGTEPKRDAVRPASLVKTDSPTAGIQEAVDALPPAGGMVTLPAGEYVLRQSIRLRSNVTLQGTGAGTLLWKKRHAESRLAATASQGSRSVQVVHASGFSVGDQVAIRDQDAMGWNVVQAIITDVQGNELRLDRPMPRVCDVARMGFVILMFPAITANQASKLVIKDLVVKDETVRDLTMYGPLDVRSKWGVILPFPLAAIHLSSATDARIENCVVTGWLSDGISLQGGGNDTVVNCRVEKCTGKGLHPGGGLHDSLFSHNVSRENGDDGLYFCAKVLRVTVSENQLIGNKANGVGGLGDWGDTLNTVTKNVISGNGMHGVQMDDSVSNTVIDNTISNNSQSAPGQYSGIWLKWTSKSTVKDNRCFDDQAKKTQKHGIDELADCHENTIANNDCHGNILANVLLAAEQPPEPQPTVRQRARAAAQPADQTRPAASRTSSTPRATKAAQVSAAATNVGPAQIVDYNDPTYGGKIRELRKDDGHEHNFYYYREVWNADGSRMLGIQSDLQQQDWRVCLYDGNGVFLKDLFSLAEYDWRLCWDRNDPDLLYTWKGSDLYRFHVGADQAELLKSFAPLGLKPNGPSCNQAGDRILIVTSDGTFHSYHLPDMTDERTFQVTLPAGCFMGWDKPHYTGYRNCIDTAYNNADSSQQAIVVYDDTGAVVHTFDSIGGGGHYDYSPDGKLAYFKLPTGGRGKPETPFEIHVVNLDGSDDRILFTVPRAQAHFSNLHLSWPAKVND